MAPFPDPVSRRIGPRARHAPGVRWCFLRARRPAIGFAITCGPRVGAAEESRGAVRVVEPGGRLICLAKHGHRSGQNITPFPKRNNASCGGAVLARWHLAPVGRMCTAQDATYQHTRLRSAHRSETCHRARVAPAFAVRRRCRATVPVCSGSPCQRFLVGFFHCHVPRDVQLCAAHSRQGAYDER